ncbi:hypothetical protein HJC23_001543 [Cyclotella cryptica]|uniref:AAA+ ATPase domain-containing protein n=1 Tax=Cyclotella cryptica TaxID=29204 RepID=A0ABD3PWM2_9STRA|eukprot:CCRYP_010755-RA/>CCRYP_010755-RA protein AED:0.13 eAED:0.13 QI:128/1/1/1/1/1/2/117/826
MVHSRFLLPQLLLLSSVHSLLTTKSYVSFAPSKRATFFKSLASLSPQSLRTADEKTSQEAARSTIERINLKNQLISYSFHWESLLTKEYQDTVAELQQRRKSYTRSQLEASGLALFNAVATPDTELYGEKIVRISLLQQSHKYNNHHGSENLREKFKRGDVLVMTPEIQFRGKDITPREGLVMDVGRDYLTLGVGTSWPAGLMEMRKHDNYIVRLDRSLSNIPLRAQRMALDKLRRGDAGFAANSIVQLFYESSTKYLNASREMPDHFDYDDSDSFDGRVMNAMSEAMSHMSFKPNESQQKAVSWALKRKMSLIRGPPGTGKTRVAALLISTALKMEMKQLTKDEETEAAKNKIQTPRILAVTHSNGAADVLLQALIDMNIPAVRGGRPASVSPAVQHRTIAALAERMPDVVKLRQQASDPSLDRLARQSAIYDSKKQLNDAQTMITRGAPVIVTSCIGAQQLLSSIAEDNGKDGSTFPIVVLDEAGQTTEPALICALASSKARQVILVGDTKQLPPTVTTEDVELRKTIGVSPMERLLKNGIDEFVLKEQYRMPESLLRHPNSYFYKGAVKCAEIGGADPSKSPPNGFPWPCPDEPLAFLEVGNDSEITHSFGSRSNPTEVKVILDIVEKVITAGEIDAKNIAIITPYNKQVQLFRTEINNANLVKSSKMSDVRVGTVDSFQGQETDLVLFSAVRSNLMKELGFLRDSRRLNVAITRARRGLIVVGDPLVLRTCQHWSALLDSCARRGCILSHVDYNAKSVSAVDGVASYTGTDRSLMNLELDKNDQFFGLFSNSDDEDDDIFGLFSESAVDDDDDELYGLFSAA